MLAMAPAAKKLTRSQPALIGCSFSPRLSVPNRSHPRPKGSDERATTFCVSISSRGRA